MTRPPVALALTGPTTSGKTALSLSVARRLDGEIISMDSRQVYRGMDIGTDKVSLRDRARVPHHGLDRVDPNERYSAGRFARDASGWIQQITSRGRVPILAGGTGFFLKALTRPLFDEPDLDPERRDALRAVLSGWDPAKLARAVRVLDPERAALAEAGGPQRVLRTLEVALLSGRSLSAWHADQRSHGQEPEAHRVLVFLMTLSREELDRRIDARVERMRESGLLAEVQTLMDAGYGPGDPGMTGTGYREIAAHLRGELTLDEALDTMKTQTRQYARRQLTWFRRQLVEPPVVLDAAMALEDQVDVVEQSWRRAVA